MIKDFTACYIVVASESLQFLSGILKLAWTNYDACMHCQKSIAIG